MDKMQGMLQRETDRQFEIEKKKNEMKLIHPEHEKYNYFTDVFQEKLKEINIRLDSSESIKQNELLLHFDKIWKDLHLLQKFVADSLLFLRDYDIRKCQKSLQDFESKTRKLEDTLLPKKKFGFKNKRIPIQLKQTSKDETDAALKKLQFNRIDEHFYGFRGMENSTLVLEDENLFKKDICLQDLRNCLVKLNGAPSTIHATNLRDCVVLCGPVATSVFTEYCTDCRFAIACQQLRVHSSTSCDFYLHVTSKAVIEDSREIQVAKYNYEYGNLQRDYQAVCLDKSVNNWAELEDFNWLVVDKHSPNWRVIPDNKRIGSWVDFQL